MVRTAAIVILGICLLGAAGWGAFTTYQLQATQNKVASLEAENEEVKRANTEISSMFNQAENELRAAQNELQQQLRTIQQQDITIRELQEERESFIAFVNELNTEMNGLLIKIWPTGEELKDIAVTIVSPTGEKREYNYLECDEPQVKLNKLGAGIEEQNDWLKEAVEELILKQSELEAATFELGKDMPVKPTEARWFDCDDSALYMFYYFTNMGYEVDIVKGNLELTGEWRLGCDHLWVVVHSNGVVYPYDWGEYCPDPQHYEYYKIGFTELILAAGIG